jgi:hypothetical protein
MHCCCERDPASYQGQLLLLQLPQRLLQQQHLQASAPWPCQLYLELLLLLLLMVVVFAAALRWLQQLLWLGSQHLASQLRCLLLAAQTHYTSRPFRQQQHH